MAAAPPTSQPADDPLYRHARREAIFVLSLWAACLIYSVTYCYVNGYLRHDPLPADETTGPAIGQLVGSLEEYDRDPESLTYPLGLGIPDWAFYGVALPWLACVAISFWFCLFFYREDDLGVEYEEPPEESPPPPIAPPPGQEGRPDA